MQIAAFRSATLVKAARCNARLSSCANEPSKAFSQDALVVVKCNSKRECFSSHCVIAAVCRSLIELLYFVHLIGELLHGSNDCFAG